MKHYYLFLIMGLFLLACQTNEQPTMPVEKQLHEGWQFKQADGEQWMPATVPGVVHTDLLNNGEIDDPFYRLNELDLQWIDKKDWVYQTEFQVSESLLQHDQLALRFEGLDTYADVYVNEQKILETDNMFRTWQAHVKSHLQPGANTLRIYFHSPTLRGAEFLEANGYPLPAGNDQSERGEMGDKRVSPFVRKAPYHFGWDWGPRLVTSGIWKPVKLVAWSGLKAEHLFVQQHHLTDEEAQLTAQAEVETQSGQTVTLRVKVNGQPVAKETHEVAAGQHTLSVDFAISQPKRWYPRGLGDAYLYDIELEIQGNQAKEVLATRYGLRTVKLVREPDAQGDGESFYFEINGRPVFAKGANYIPNSVFVTDVSDEKYEYIIQSAADAHMNMIRVWGGGIYEKDIFYELCDEKGIMVFQDFMFACSMYDGSEEYLNSVRHEAIDNVKRLRNHPSIVLWCGNNEIEVAWAPGHEDKGWGWKQRYNQEQREEIWGDYEAVFHEILPDIVAQYTDSLPYWPSSPTGGDGRLAGYDTNTGDIHYWGVWHGEHPFADFANHVGRFMSEYGFQSFPEFQSVKKYTQPEDYDIESEVMLSHQRSPIGNQRIRSYMQDHYQVPGNFADFLYVGQLLQAKGMKMAVDIHRAQMPYCMGSLYWQLNDTWPVASWSGIDYYGRWKAMHYALRDAMQPLSLAIYEKDSMLHGYVVSDVPENQSVKINTRILNLAGEVLWQRAQSAEVAYGESKAVFRDSLPALWGQFDKARTILVAEIMQHNQVIDRETWHINEPKDLQLPNPNLQLAVEETAEAFVVSVNAEQLAKKVFLYLQDVDEGWNRFSNNYFDVLPGETMEVTYPKTMDRQEFESALQAKTLFDTL